MLARYAAITLSVAVLFLTGLGLVMLASTSPWVEPEHLIYSHLKKQIVFVLLGLIGAGVCGFIPFRVYQKYWWVIFGAAVVLLALCYVPGIRVISGGAARWIKFPVIGQFQPSEASKLAIAITLASCLTYYKNDIRTFFKGFIAPIILLGIPVALIFFEKDMGTAASVMAAGIIVMYIGGTNVFYLLATALGGFAGLAFLVRMDENRWNRIMAFQDLEASKLDYGLQQYRALLAFGSGGVDGVGLGNGAEKHGYLPFAHTDFIYPIIGEELGLTWTLLVIFAFVLIAVAGFILASQMRSRFASLLTIAITALTVIPAWLNIGVTTASLPNTGLPLPFVSYGGTNLVFTLSGIGIILGLYFRDSQDLSEPAVKLKKNIPNLRL